MKPAVRSVIAHLYKHDFPQLHRDWLEWLSGKKLQTVFTPNPEQIVLAQENAAYAQTLQSGDVFLPDGIGLVAAEAILFRRKEPLSRLTGVEVVEWWLREGAQGKVRTLLLGGFDDTAKVVAQRFDLTGEWCSALPGYQDVSAPSAAEEKALEELLKTWKPKVVFVAFGAPAQEQWVKDHAALLEEVGVRVAMVCGGAFDFLSGRVPRAPRFLRSLGLEWAFRLWQQPWRWRRQIKLLTFLQLVVQELVLNGREDA